jgi:Zn-dependent membrane protease YugP
MFIGSPFLFDPTWLLLILISTGLGIAAQSWVSRTFKRWSTVPLSTSESGAMVARRILDANGLSQVDVKQAGGRDLADNYDPRSKSVNLSQAVYAGRSVAAAGVAAHETGHAVQDAEGYAWGRVRSAFVPVARFGSMAAWPLILFGFWLGLTGFVWVGVLGYAAAVLFQVVTLPVELNASRRALESLTTTASLPPVQVAGAKQVLTAAAFTYVAAALISALQLLYLLGFTRRG